MARANESPFEGARQKWQAERADLRDCLNFIIEKDHETFFDDLCASDKAHDGIPYNEEEEAQKARNRSHNPLCIYEVGVL
ncbi:hypothetical protein FACS1894159_00540 [Bacteroidia bacterium]|nr:hypothetical protein FACS1894159_00540 [Bacteroidia bacterium]